MPWSGSYEELKQYLRGFANIRGEVVPYDFNGVVHLMLSLLDNLQENALEAELTDIRESLTEDQAAFFLKVADYIRQGGQD